MVNPWERADNVSKITGQEAPVMLKRLLIVVVVAVVVVGYFRNWFSFSSSQDADSARVGVTIDKSKVRDDATKAETRVRELKDTRTGG